MLRVRVGRPVIQGRRERRQGADTDALGGARGAAPARGTRANLVQVFLCADTADCMPTPFGLRRA